MKCTVDLDLAASSARSFSQAAGVGCLLAYPDGEVIVQAGYVCTQCNLCTATNGYHSGCAKKHAHALKEAERFGGKYVYFCPHGLSFAVSPIMGQTGCEAKFLAGPFLMSDTEDYLSLELSSYMDLSPSNNEKNLRAWLSEIPYVPPARVSALSNMLFLAAGFVSSAQEVMHLRMQEASDQLQGQISAYILQMKQEERKKPYPYSKEQNFLDAMTQNRRKDAKLLLNELLGEILIISGMSFSRIKAYVNELLVLMFRKAVENHADPTLIQQNALKYYQELTQIQGFEELFFWLSEIVNQMMNDVFDLGNSKYVRPLQRSISYIRSNLHEKLTLKQIAAEAFLSPAYFSRVFKQETGKTVQQFIVEERLDKAIQLMRRRELNLLEIAALVGIRSPSLFNRLFKKAYDLSPGEFRKKLFLDDENVIHNNYKQS